MARGFESKSVADQQEAAQNVLDRRREEVQPDPVLAARRRTLELARVDVEHQLERATAPAYRKMLERALADLDKQLAEIAR